MERRRSIEEVNDRLRAREAAIAEGIERAETDARARLELTLIDFERRQTERLERITEREVDRHVQIAATQFDERMREIREESATRSGTGARPGSRPALEGRALAATGRGISLIRRLTSRSKERLTIAGQGTS